MSNRYELLRVALSHVTTDTLNRMHHMGGWDATLSEALDHELLIRLSPQTEAVRTEISEWSTEVLRNATRSAYETDLVKALAWSKLLGL